VLDTELDTVPRSIGITTLADTTHPASVQHFLQHLVEAAHDLDKELSAAIHRPPRRRSTRNASR